MNEFIDDMKLEKASDDYYNSNFHEKLAEVDESQFEIVTNSKNNDTILVDYDSRDIERLLSLLNMFNKIIAPIMSVRLWRSKSKGYHVVVNIEDDVWKPVDIIRFSGFLGGDEKHIMIAENTYDGLNLKNSKNRTTVDGVPNSENDEYRYMALFRPRSSVVFQLTTNKSGKFVINEEDKKTLFGY
jgi:hypothetical protein